MFGDELDGLLGIARLRDDHHAGVLEHPRHARSQQDLVVGDQDPQRRHGPERSLRLVNRRPQLRILAPAASPHEAAAVVAALERFMRETAPPPAPATAGPPAWRRAGLLASSGHAPGEAPPWGAPRRWA